MDINDKNRRISRINTDDGSIWAIPLPPTKLMVPSYTKLENEEQINNGSSWKAPKLKREQKRAVDIARAYSETAPPHLQQDL